MSFGSAWGSVWAGGSGGYGWANWNRQLGRTRYDYASQTDPSTSAVVMACVLWICRTFPEAPLQILQDQPDDTQEPVRRHPLSELLKRPNQYYSGILLWYATLTDWLTTGNAYWVKVRSGAGRVVELWWVPQHMMQPRWPADGSVFLSHYEYRPDGLNVVKVDVEDVVHFRYGIDPDNVRKGLSPLASLMREVFTDDEAANFTSSILKNMGVPSVVLSPDDDVSVGIDDLERIKAEFMARFGGDRRGEPLIMSGKTKVSVLSFNPQQMDLKALRRIPEERVSAIFGTPAIVVGLGAGLDRSTFANYAEAREAAYESNIIPTQALLAAELDIQLLPDFADPTTTQVGFDLSKVRVLQADQNQLHERAREDLKAGLLTRNAALLMIGEETDPNSDVLYVPNLITVKLITELDAPPPATPPALPTQQVTMLPPDGTTPTLPALPKPTVAQQAKRYADLDLVAALQEHALVLAEGKNGHAAH